MLAELSNESVEVMNPNQQEDIRGESSSYAWDRYHHCISTWERSWWSSNEKNTQLIT